MTNSSLLLQISDLKNEIEDQTNLCPNIFKLENVRADSVIELIETTIVKIDKLKNYQNIMILRNNSVILFNEQEISVQELIKMKEGLLLKKKLKTHLTKSSSNDNLIQIALEAFQDIQDYKKLLSEIHTTLEKFNNIEFEIKDYL